MKPTKLSNSRRNTWARCRTLWAFVYAFRLTVKRQFLRLATGKAWHRAQDSFWAQPTGNATTMQMAVWEWFAEMRKQAEPEAESFSVSAVLPSWSLDDLKDARDTLLTMCNGYAARYAVREFELIGTELDLTIKLRSPSGRRSGCLLYNGKIDKLVRDEHGQAWIVEHKTTKTPVDRWREWNEYKPQAPSYAVLCREALGIEPVGVIYDLALLAAPPRPENWPILKNGKALAKKVPANATAETLREALSLNGFTVEGGEWYAEILAGLEKQPDPFFSRVVVRFEPHAIERTAAELYQVARSVRADEKRASVFEPLVRDLEKRKCGPEALAQLADLPEWFSWFPRNPGACHMFGRMCEFADACRFLNSPEALSAFDWKQDEDNENEGGSNGEG